MTYAMNVKFHTMGGSEREEMSVWGGRHEEKEGGSLQRDLSSVQGFSTVA